MVSPVKVHHDILLLPNQQNEIAPSSVQREQRKGAVREQAGVRDQVAVVLEHRRPPHEQSRCQRRTPHGHHRARACRDVAPADEDLSSAPALNRSITQDDTRESCMRAGYIASNVISLGPPPPPPPPGVTWHRHSFSFCTAFNWWFQLFSLVLFAAFRSSQRPSTGQ